MKVLVTGGAGFIGSAVVRAMLDRGHEVIVLDAFTYAGRRENLANLRYMLALCDVTDAEGTAEVVLKTRPDAIAHLAAESHVDASFVGRKRFYTTNVLGTENVLSAALSAGVQNVLHVSTDEVFGDAPAGTWYVEESRLAPRSPYAASKAAAEMVVESYRESFGFPVKMVRLANCFGPRQHVEKLVPLTISRILAGHPAILHSDGRQTREWIPVESAARVIVDAVESSKSGTWNIPGEEAAVGEVVQAIADALPRLNPTILCQGDRPGGTDRRYAMQGVKAAKDFGWKRPDGVLKNIAAFARGVACEVVAEEAGAKLLYNWPTEVVH